MWASMLESGVHATIAGVLAALAIPARPKFDPNYFDKKIQMLVDKFKAFPVSKDYQLADQQQAVLEKMEETVHEVQAPLNRLEHNLHLPVSLLIIPLFALANAGIALKLEGMGEMLMQPVTLGIMAGLVLGKVIGIAGISWIVIKLGLAKLPSGANFSQLFGVAFLGGIGFTMSIFIADLAWETGDAMLMQAKMGILFASLFAGIVGYVWLHLAAKKK